MNSILHTSSYRWQLWAAGIVFIVSLLGLALTLPAQTSAEDCWIEGLMTKKVVQRASPLAFKITTSNKLVSL